MSEMYVKYKFEIFITVKVHIVDIRVMTLCNLAGGYEILGRKHFSTLRVKFEIQAVCYV
jgi:hypothetical protein